VFERGEREGTDSVGTLDL
jgi:hypothetical protein